MMATLMTKTGAAVRPDDLPSTAFGKDRTQNHYLIIHDQSLYLKHTTVQHTHDCDLYLKRVMIHQYQFRINAISLGLQSRG